jgi:hypothetical protein
MTSPASAVKESIPKRIETVINRHPMVPCAKKSGHQLWIAYLKSLDANIAGLSNGTK